MGVGRWRWCCLLDHPRIGSVGDGTDLRDTALVRRLRPEKVSPGASYCYYRCVSHVFQSNNAGAGVDERNWVGLDCLISVVLRRSC